ncbi:MAG: pyridoxal phosphate-dependent aminotransferase family protein [Bacteriovoracaceae bacterium]|nr:pyridoxal phosphate-dependent aminotransferase family protein [Bacteriovoracaceae bacterium]
MSNKKKFYDFHVEKPRKDILENLKEFETFYTREIERDEYAYRRALKTPTSSNVEVVCKKSEDSSRMIMMGSNNYLDFASDERVVKASKNALEKYGYGAGSVPLLAGTFEIHKELEKRIASFYGRESSAVFSSGYSANLGVISSLIQKDDLILLDMYSHASIVDGTKLTEATVKYFKHNDMDHLEKILKRLRDKFGGVLIVTDGVFSMDGDLCTLDKLIDIKKKYNARLMIDEAHAIGVIGDTGRGTEEYFGLKGEVDVITGTLSKAPAGLGGYVVGSSGLVEYIRHLASSYIFSTGLPPSIVGGLIEVFKIMESDLARMKLLQKNIVYFTTRLRKLGFNIGDTITAIVPVIIGDEDKTKKISCALARSGVFVSAVIFPAVRKTQSRIRFSLMSAHTGNEIEFVLKELETLGREYGVI